MIKKLKITDLYDQIYYKVNSIFADLYDQI